MWSRAWTCAIIFVTLNMLKVHLNIQNNEPFPKNIKFPVQHIQIAWESTYTAQYVNFGYWWTFSLSQTEINSDHFQFFLFHFMLPLATVNFISQVIGNKVFTGISKESKILTDKVMILSNSIAGAIWKSNTKYWKRDKKNKKKHLTDRQ